jgi:hypothetical protein
MDYPVYIYAEKVYHMDIGDYWMNEKRGASPLLAEGWHRQENCRFLLWAPYRYSYPFSTILVIAVGERDMHHWIV